MKDFFQEVNPGFQSYLTLAATLTLVVENFYSQMCSRNDMPTVLEFARLFVPYEDPLPRLAINTLPSLRGDEQRGSKDDKGLARQLWKTSSPAERS